MLTPARGSPRGSAKEVMLAKRKAGYQERLIDALAADVRKALGLGAQAG